jgi:hypothetical protein
LIYIGPGEDFSIEVLTNAFLRPGADAPRVEPSERELPNPFADMQQLVRNAQRANVNIYSIDPTGLPPPDPKTGRLRGEGLRDFLLTMSNQSGGRAIVLNNEPYREVPAIIAENGAYYLLGYRSTDQTQDGKLRAIEVRVNRPDVDVRARRGYIAPGGRTRPAAAEMPALDSALSRLIPSTGIPIDVSIAPFASATEGQVALVLSMTVGAESVKGPLELAMVLFDEKGEPALTQSGTVPASAFAGGSADLMVPVRFDVKPGRYGVRVDTVSGQRLHHDRRARSSSRTALAFRSRLRGHAGAAHDIARLRHPLSSIRSDVRAQVPEHGRSTRLPAVLSGRTHTSS